MPLPELLQHACTSVALDINRDPFVYPTPHQRRAIYRIIGGWDDSLGRRVRAWLALFAAQRALPLFQPLSPESNLPSQLLELSHQVLQEPVDHATISEFAELAYHEAGHCWGYLDDEIPEYVDYAGQAAYTAFTGTTDGRFFLQDLDTGVFTLTPAGFHLITGGEWTNQRLIEFPNAPDAALYAAAALATNPETGVWEVEPWNTLWLWWLNEAIPFAWERAMG